MDFKPRALEELRQRSAAAPQRLGVVGLDGFVDTIVTPVALRTGQGEAFEPIPTLAEFGQRIVSAAGKSTNIELYPRLDKLGGNGPIMANALLAQGLRVKYIGALGRGAIHPVFQAMANQAEVVSICDPAATTAVEFTDGKLMLGQMRCLDEITFDRLVERMGLPALTQALAAADVVALVNWTMIPNMTGIFERILSEVLPRLPAKDRVYFFDLADPEKRSRADLLQALQIIGQYGRFGRVTLGLNLKEAQQVWAALDQPPAPETETGLREMAAGLRERLGLACVVVHPKESAAAATAEGTAWVPGPYCAKPLITTGAGDHFNAGFVTGQLLGLSLTSCLATGVCTSGHYVRTGQSPSLSDLQTFLANWA
jgi:sugar/nucleoside kinase (ribokinase family)